MGEIRWDNGAGKNSVRPRASPAGQSTPFLVRGGSNPAARMRARAHALAHRTGVDAVYNSIRAVEVLKPWRAEGRPANMDVISDKMDQSINHVLY
jgi:hypothetical protein